MTFTIFKFRNGKYLKGIYTSDQNYLGFEVTTDVFKAKQYDSDEMVADNDKLAYLDGEFVTGEIKVRE
ncbi:hypothetical protein IWT25_02175 [Secundilactobacillus pentosiphilus]|uniref:Uncharacterized protein n=1 Tax=Secundilactobacillus pentosiphilus TaxID=1714682 RepID=A0A1Z5IZ65_9LACO|nr:hypothetical protein [Secundilactobacillus pentosiphilus]GAX06828.1 hypothetical protein IWT25_02175 [Secundilactobacillus pentosiphilus]